jgi:hypothetical protein
MSRSPAFSRPLPSLGLWVSGLLVLLGGIWLGLLSVEFGFTALAPGANGGWANFWSKQTLYGAIASLASMAIGVLIFYFSRYRGSGDHAHHHRRHYAHRSATPHRSKTVAHSSSASTSDADESVSFDMDEASRDAQLPPDTPGAPPPRPKVRVKVRVKKRIRKHSRDS